MSKTIVTIIEGQILNDDVEHDIKELCRYAEVSLAQIQQMVDEGILDPHGSTPNEWRFNQRDFSRTRIVAHLQHDLDVNLPGAAIIVELLEQRL